MALKLMSERKEIEKMPNVVLVFMDKFYRVEHGFNGGGFAVHVGKEVPF